MINPQPETTDMQRIDTRRARAVLRGLTIRRPNTKTRQAKSLVKSQAKSQLGMTLIEIMVVVAIISLIMGGIGVMAFNRFQDAELDTAKSQTIALASAVEQYRISKRKCPKSLQDLKASGFAKLSKDPWGGEYEFKCPGDNGSVDVMSAGPDLEMGTEDDVTNFGEDKVIEE